MDRTTLSKHKYIYEVYIAEDKRIHFQRYPVVYINAKFVYYVRGDKQMLGFLNLISVHDSLESHMQNNANKGRHANYGVNRMFCWEIGRDPNELRAELQASTNRSEKEKQIALAKQRWEMAESNAADAKKKYEALLKD